jgi:hypothetical protein
MVVIVNREDIARMMRDSHLNVYGLGKDHEKFFTVIERFAALVASAERERLAKVFDERDKDIGWYDPGEPAEIIRGQA